MLVCFGASWPLAIAKTFKSKTAKGKSVAFLFLILLGYAFGVINKLIHYPGDNVVYLWTLNGLMVFCDLALSLYYRRTRDQQATGLPPPR